MSAVVGELLNLKWMWHRDARAVYWQYAVDLSLDEEAIRVFLLFLRAYRRPRNRNLLWYTRTGLASVIRDEARTLENERNLRRWAPRRNKQLLRILKTLEERGAIYLTDTRVEREQYPMLFSGNPPKRRKNETSTYQPRVLPPDLVAAVWSGRVPSTLDVIGRAVEKDGPIAYWDFVLEALCAIRFPDWPFPDRFYRGISVLQQPSKAALEAITFIESNQTEAKK